MNFASAYNFTKILIIHFVFLAVIVATHFVKTEGEVATHFVKTEGEVGRLFTKIKICKLLTKYCKQNMFSNKAHKV